MWAVAADLRPASANCRDDFADHCRMRDDSADHCRMRRWNRDLYAQGQGLRQIGLELGVPWTALSDQLRRTGVSMRSSGPPAHAASTQQITELRDQGLTWNEIAEQIDMTISGAWSRYRRARPPKPPRLGRWQQVLADALDQNLAISVRAAVADHLGRAPAGLSSRLHDAPPTVSRLSVVPPAAPAGC
jgi:hypothetical protein